MTRLARRASLLVAFFLLTSAATAYAECAWVLWLMGGSSPWSVFRAFSTREACIEAMHHQAAAIDKRSLKVTQDTSGGAFTANARGQIRRGQCLPDAVDPRGPKGGPR
ncbi:MAG: hypothetical protein DMD96_05790 [Candidatus Rokuibacteriota bacterium]|nr:MAG: hypothetical protein DMD96_05790 [Candidatus Rokubacteria bacterium]